MVRSHVSSATPPSVMVLFNLVPYLVMKVMIVREVHSGPLGGGLGIFKSF